MKKTIPKSTSPATQLPKCPTGIQGLDEITGGGVPRRRPPPGWGGGGGGGTRGGRRSPRRRGRGVRQDAVGRGIPRARSGAVRRAGRVHGLRGDGSGVEGQRRLARI